MTKLQLCKTLEVDSDLCYIYVTLCYEFHGPTKATKSGIRASEIGLRAIFHFGNGSVTFDHTLFAIRHNNVVAVLRRAYVRHA